MSSSADDAAASSEAVHHHSFSGGASSFTAYATVASAAAAAPSADASSAAFHWQEKPQTTWVLAALTAALRAVRFSLPGCHARIIAATAHGDATVTLRRGSKGIFFDLRVTAAWEGSLIDDDGVVTGTGDGALVVENLDQETAGGPGGAGAEYGMCWTVDDDADRADTRLRAILEEFGTHAVRKAVAGVIEELRKRG